MTQHVTPLRLSADNLGPPATTADGVPGPLRHKVLFGSDYPVISPDRWIASFDDLEIKPEVRPLIMKQNAIEVLGLARRD